MYDYSYWPDKAVAKEVMFQRVFCSYRERGCQWEGHLKEYEVIFLLSTV